MTFKKDTGQNLHSTILPILPNTLLAVEKEL